MEKLTVNAVRDRAYKATDNVRVLEVRPTDHADAALIVNGDGMAPLYRDGDIVAIAFSDTLEPGDIGVFLVGNDVILRQYYPYSLRAFRPDLTSVRVSCSEGYKIIGRCVGVVAEGAKAVG